MLLDVSDSPLLRVGEGSRFGVPSDFLDVRGLEEVLREDAFFFCFRTPPRSSPSDFLLFASVTESSVESSLLKLFGLDLELGGCDCE